MSLTLNTESVEQGQVSPRDSQKDVNPLKYAMLGYKTAKVKVEDIQHFELIPDYATPTAATIPIVVVSPDGVFCLDGWDMVAEAKKKNRKSIPCEVEIMAEYSDQELCLRKTAIRTITRGGHAAYIELCRDSAITFELLKASREDLMFFSHGGRRVKDDLKDNKIDAMHILAVRLGRDRDTIGKHLSHVEWLSPAAMQVLIEQNAGKRFFEKAKTKKENLLRELEADGKSSEEIIEQVSTLMLDEWKKFNEKKASSPASEIPPTEASPETIPDAIPVEEYPTDADGAEDLDETDDEAPASDEGEPDIVNVDTVKKSVLDVSIRIAEKVTDEMSLDELEDCITAEMKVFMKMLDDIAHLRNALTTKG
jgi:hypothetical protein